ncbi:MAG: hypothetical protein WC612_07535 [Bdellovibrionales bacterium]|jgi:hypothetical protein
MTTKKIAAPLKFESRYYYYDPKLSLAFTAECPVEICASTACGACASDTLIIQHFTRSGFDICPARSRRQNTLTFQQKDFDKTCTDDSIVLYVPNGVNVKAQLSGKRAYLIANTDANLRVTLSNTSRVSQIRTSRPLYLHMDKAKAELEVWENVNLLLGRGKNSATIRFIENSDSLCGLVVLPYVYDTKFGKPIKSVLLEGEHATGLPYAKTIQHEKGALFSGGRLYIAKSFPRLKVISPAPKV